MIISAPMNDAAAAWTGVTSVASALEQQRTATREISGSAQHASAALNDINMRVKMIAA